MSSNAKIGAAVVGGYVLGRRKKAKVALGLGVALAGAGARRHQLGKALSESPIVGTVNERLRGELKDAGKAAATTVLTARADKLADAIHDRTEALREADEAEEAAENTEKTEDTEETEDTEDTEPEGEAHEDKEPEGKASGAKTSGDRKPAHTGTTSRARKTAAKPRAKSSSASSTRKRSTGDG